jgi:hypothetical protein
MDMRENPNYYFNEVAYKSKYICVHCRKSFKRKLLSDIAGDDKEEIKPVCPICSRESTWIGPKFRSPKTENINAWRSIEILNDIGVLDFIGWAGVPVVIPESSKGLKDMLLSMKEKEEHNVRKWLSNPYHEDIKNQIKYSSDKLKKIDSYLKTL